MSKSTMGWMHDCLGRGQRWIPLGAQCPICYCTRKLQRRSG
jgi:hypothetical protein